MSRTIEIRKTNFTNKGAAMMLIAASQVVRRRLPDVRVAVVADFITPFEDRARLGLWHRAEMMRGGVDLLGPLVAQIPEKLRTRFGFVTEGEIDTILDAAGFAYSDQWGPDATRDLARRARRWKKMGKKLILLPQAFGPFEGAGMREAMREVADCAELIFAREQSSYSHLIGAVGERPNIQMAPDFTNMLDPVPSTLFRKGSGRVAIVPNARMIDKTDAAESGHYLKFLADAVQMTQSSGLTPFVLVHESLEDGAIAEHLNASLPAPIEVICADDPLVAKGIIAECELLIGSRFHALISALSQAVPVLGTGWSHKYRELFKDYDYPEGLMQVDIDQAQMVQALAPVLSEQGRSDLSKRLSVAANRLKGEVSHMWDQVFKAAL